MKCTLLYLLCNVNHFPRTNYNGCRRGNICNLHKKKLMNSFYLLLVLCILFSQTYSFAFKLYSEPWIIEKYQQEKSDEYVNDIPNKIFCNLTHNLQLVKILKNYYEYICILNHTLKLG